MSRFKKGIIKERAAALVMLPEDEFTGIDLMRLWDVSASTVATTYEKMGTTRLIEAQKAAGMGVSQFASELGIHENLVYSWIHRKYVKFVRVAVYRDTTYSIDTQHFIARALPSGLCINRLLDDVCDGIAGTAIWRDIVLEARAAFLAGHISRGDLIAMLGWSNTNIDYHKKYNKFPRPIKRKHRGYSFYERKHIVAWLLEHPRHISPAVAREFGF